MVLLYTVVTAVKCHMRLLMTLILIFFLTINQMICGKYGVFLLPVGILGWGFIL